MSRVFHVLAVAAAEEGDRRASVLAAIADDLEPVEAGELVEDLPGLLDQLRADWTVDDDGPAST